MVMVLVCSFIGGAIWWWCGSRCGWWDDLLLVEFSIYSMLVQKNKYADDEGCQCICRLTTCASILNSSAPLAYAHMGVAKNLCEWGNFDFGNWRFVILLVGLFKQKILLNVSSHSTVDLGGPGLCEMSCRGRPAHGTFGLLNCKLTIFLRTRAWTLLLAWQGVRLILPCSVSEK